MLKLFLANDNYFKNIESILSRYKVMYKYMYVISYILYHPHKLSGKLALNYFSGEA